MLNPNDIVEIAQDLLSKRFGGVQELSDPEQLSGSGSAIVLRTRVAASPFLQQRSVILKYTPKTEDELDDAALIQEIAAYQFTNSLSEDVRPGPSLLAHDLDERIIVLTDSGDGDTFAELLEQRDPQQRVEILRNLGMALGRMHAGTAGKEGSFDTLLARVLRSRPDSQQDQRVRDNAFSTGIESGLALVENSGFEVPQAVSRLMGEAISYLQSGFSRAFTPFDLSPDNIIVADRTHFLDYEWAGFRDVSFDLACVIGGFPQFVSSGPISDDEAQVFVTAWVDEVKDTWPSVTNEDTLHQRITGALLGWALSSVSIMHFGSLSLTLAALSPHSDAVEDGSFLLRAKDASRFSDEDRLMRRDLFETFEALSRFAAHGRGDDFQVVSSFSAELAERLAEPQR